MFILTNVDISSDLVQVYDTKDNTNDVVSLSAVAQQVLNKSIKIYGVGCLDSCKRRDIVPLVPYKIYICNNEAKEALVTFYMQHGFTREQAKARVGLV